MYEPPLHRQSDPAALHALIRAHPLGLLISHGPSGLLANAIPFILDAEAAPRPILRAHLARANSQLGDLAETNEALVVFQGVDHYVSPSWYATKAETHKVVPTWNYLIVQARGKPRVIEDAPWLRAQIEALTARKSLKGRAVGRRRRAAGFCRPADARHRRPRDRGRRHPRQVEGEPEPQRSRPRRRRSPGSRRKARKLRSRWRRWCGRAANCSRAR